MSYKLQTLSAVEKAHSEDLSSGHRGPFEQKLVQRPTTRIKHRSSHCRLCSVSEAAQNHQP